MATPGTERKANTQDRLNELELALAARDRELATLSELAARLHSEDDPQRIFEVVLDAVLQHMELDAAWIFWGSDEDKRLHLAAARGISQEYVDHIKRDGLEDCLCPEVFWTGHRMQARNTLQCPRMPTIIPDLAAPVAHACIPLRFEGLTRGVLNVAARPAATFSDRELHFLETVGYQLCLAVERARHMQAERSRNREARALASITKAIGRSLELSAVLRAVGETARDVLAVEQVLVLLGSDPTEMSVAYQSQPGHLELELGRRVDLVQRGFKLLRMVVSEHLSAAIDSAVDDPRVNPDLTRRYGVGSCAAAPLLAGERVLGLLFFTNGHKRHWSEEQIVVVDGLAAQAAVAIENARLYADARQALGDLQRAQQRVLQQEKMATLGTFASGLAHEVRNPLNSMGLQLALLERRINRLDPALTRDLDNVIGILRQEIRRLDALVGDFLLFARTDRMQYRDARLDVLIDEVIQLLAPEAATNDVALERQRGGAPLPFMQMDAEKMRQVLINLIRNAIEAMPEGGTVTIESDLAEGQARIVVRDTGPGLPQGLDVFQLFVTTKPKGTGLGLAIAQQIVLQHGGDIAAGSRPGEGAAFTISLPLSGGAQEDR